MKKLLLVLVMFVSTISFAQYGGLGFSSSGGASLFAKSGNYVTLGTDSVGLNCTPTERFEVFGNVIFRRNTSAMNFVGQVIGFYNSYWLIKSEAYGSYYTGILNGIPGLHSSGGAPIVNFDFVTLNVGIGTTAPEATARLDVSSTTKGFLPPRMTTTQKNAISTPAEGLIVYDLTLHKLFVYTGSAWEVITSL